MTDLTKSLQDYLSAMKVHHIYENDEPDYARRAGVLEAVLQFVVTDVVAYADPKTVEAVALSLHFYTKGHRDAIKGEK